MPHFPKFPPQAKITNYISKKITKSLALGPCSPLNVKDSIIYGNRLTSKHHMMQQLKRDIKKHECFVFECAHWEELIRSRDEEFKLKWLHSKCVENIKKSLEYIQSEDKRWLLENWLQWLQEEGPTLETLEEFFEIVKRCHIYPTIFFFENWDEMWDKSKRVTSEHISLPSGFGDPVSALIMSQKTEKHEYGMVVKSVNINANSLTTFAHTGPHEERYYSVPLDSIDPLIEKDPFPFHENLSQEEKEKEIQELKRIFSEETVAYPWVYKIIGEYYKARSDMTVRSAWEVVQKQIYMFISKGLPQHLQQEQHHTHNQYLQHHTTICAEIFDYFIAKRSDSIGTMLQDFLLKESLTYFSDFRSQKANIHPICGAVKDALIDFWIPFEKKLWNFETSTRCHDLKNIFYHNSDSPKRRDAIMMELLRRFLCDKDSKDNFNIQLRSVETHKPDHRHSFKVTAPYNFVQLKEDSDPSILSEEYPGKGTTFFTRDARDENTDFQLIVRNEHETLFFKNAELRAFNNEIHINKDWLQEVGGKSTVALIIPQRQYNQYQEERFKPQGVTEGVYAAFYEDWIENIQDVILFIRDQKKTEKENSAMFEDVAFSEKELDQLMKLSRKVRLLDTKERSLR